MREITLLDQGWKFHLGDIEPEEPVWGFLKSGTHNQSGGAKKLDDSRWREINLPHDFVMEAPATPPSPRDGKPRSVPNMDYLGDQHVLHGCRQGSIAWYRKKIRVDSAGKRVYLKFDGVYRDSQIYVNEFLVGSHQSGYTEAIYDVTDFLADDEENLIAVRVDARLGEGWFYEGGGIYRHVWLVTTPLVSIDFHGVWVKSQVDLEKDTAQLTIQTKVVNRSGKAQETAVSHCVTAPDGQQVSIEPTSVLVDGWAEQTVEQTLSLPHPQLWDLETPRLYTVETSLDGEKDTITEFGIRSIRFDTDRGFFLNGRPLKLKGVCCHQDHGGLGTALPDGMWEYRIGKLKEMGCNAYRCAHNPVSEELLRACDTLGMLVMDENRLLSSSQEDLFQLRQMVLSGRNHPSVILWSLGNEEVHVQFTPQGRKIAETMRSVVRSLDDSRPVTAAVCMWEAGKVGQTVEGTEKQGTLAPSVDLFGFNYFSGIWDSFHQAYPKLPLICTEDSTFSETRGCRKTEAENCHLCAMDKQQGNYRGGERAWKDAAQREYLAGTFLWTGFDYHGEPAPYGWPAVASQFGIMDLCGFPKDTYYYYKAWWGSEDVLHLCPGEGSLWCFTNCDAVELWSHGTCLGKQQVEPNGFLEWDSISPDQELVAVGYRNGKEVMRTERRSHGPAHTLQAWVDGDFQENDGSRTVVVNIQLLDKDGQFVENGDNHVVFSFPQQIQLLGTCNGDPSCHEDPKKRARSAFHGKLQAIFRVTGSRNLVIEAAGMESVTLSL